MDNLINAAITSIGKADKAIPKLAISTSIALLINACLITLLLQLPDVA